MAKKKIKVVGRTRPKADLKETLSTIFWALMITMVLRTFVFQPFHIPSGSMQPNLVKGDYIITTKYTLGFGKFAAAPLPFPIKSGRLLEREPNRGDVIVFRPKDNDNNYVKRLIGFPGEEIQMKLGRLYINGKPVDIKGIGTDTRLDVNGQDDDTNLEVESFDKKTSYEIYNDIAGSPTDDTKVFIVPAGHYFMMGDNRDHSADSRIPVSKGGAGFVPTENLIGNARLVLLSVTEDFQITKPWTWMHVKKDRFFKVIE